MRVEFDLVILFAFVTVGYGDIHAVTALEMVRLVVLPLRCIHSTVALISTYLFNAVLLHDCDDGWYCHLLHTVWVNDGHDRVHEHRGVTIP